jgi:HD-GYP domain-containing protein (c-di-GMP phosphodiesterase class II)
MEHQVVMKHPIWGHDRLMNSNYLTSQAASVVLFHHERCNGKGYPFGKTRDDIPLYARICAIADTFETLTAASPNSAPMTPFQALTVMQQDMAGSFDSQLFRAFVEMLGSG